MLRWLYSIRSGTLVTYRVSHETWQLVNSFECLLPYSVLIYKDFLQFISLQKSFTQIYFTLKQFYFKYNWQIILFIILFDINQLKKLGKKTFQTIHHLSCFVGHPVFCGKFIVCLHSVHANLHEPLCLTFLYKERNVQF